MTRHAIVKHRAQQWRLLEEARQATIDRNRLAGSRLSLGRYEALSAAAGVALLALVNACHAARVEVWQAMKYLAERRVPRTTHRPGCERYTHCVCKQLAAGKSRPRLRPEQPLY